MKPTPKDTDTGATDGLTRRQVLSGSAALVIAGIFGGRIPAAWADAEGLQAALDEFAGGATPEAGRVNLKTPEIAENGNTVPISVSVDSPMTEDDYVESVIILAELNPNPEVITFNFSSASGKAEAATRMRLAKTQNVVAVAKMSDGSLFTDTKNVKVTIGGCGG